MDIQTKGSLWIVNNRYEIDKNDGHISDTKGNNIPQEIYDLKDRLIYNNK